MILGIGMQKTGTTSLHNAMNILGISSSHCPVNMVRDITFGDFRSFKNCKTKAIVDCVCHCFEDYDRIMPGSKFILTIRDEEEWIRSCKNFFDSKKMYDIRRSLHKFHIISVFGIIRFDEKRFMDRYRAHNSRVMDYFNGRDDLLVFRTGVDGWNELCEFLKLPVPDCEYPHKNVGRK